MSEILGGGKLTESVYWTPLLPVSRKDCFRLPTASVYDIGNTSTTLVLVNSKKKKNCRLKGFSSAELGRDYHPNPDRHQTKDISSLHHKECLKTLTSHPGPFVPETNYEKLIYRDALSISSSPTRSVSPDQIKKLNPLPTPSIGGGDVKSAMTTPERQSLASNHIDSLPSNRHNKHVAYTGPSDIRRQSRISKDTFENYIERR